MININSGMEKSSFILKNIKENGFNIENMNLSDINKVPMMIRTNGLILTLEYLLKKTNEKTSKIAHLIINYILKYNDIGITKQMRGDKWEYVVRKIKSLQSYKYMYVQKDVYEFSVILKRLSLSTKNNGGEEQSWENI